jgi:hypothetical protein
MKKHKDKWTSLEIERIYYPIIIAIFSFIFAYSYIGKSFERNVTYMGSADYGQGARDKVTVVYMDEVFLYEQHFFKKHIGNNINCQGTSDSGQSHYGH